MMTQYQILLHPNKQIHHTPEIAYLLYGALLEQCSKTVGNALHKGVRTPISQYVQQKQYDLLWCIHIFGDDLHKQISPILQNCRSYVLHKYQICFSVKEIQTNTIYHTEKLFEIAQSSNTHTHRLQFHTPTAFRSKGQYQILPNTTWILQSILRQWNVCISDYVLPCIHIQELSEQLICRDLYLHCKTYPLKQTKIPGFVGSMVLENTAEGFHQTLLDVLLYVSQFTGIGIKTGLGMGGVSHMYV